MEIPSRRLVQTELIDTTWPIFPVFAFCHKDIVLNRIEYRTAAPERGSFVKAGIKLNCLYIGFPYRKPLDRNVTKSMIGK